MIRLSHFAISHILKCYIGRKAAVPGQVVSLHCSNILFKNQVILSLIQIVFGLFSSDYVYDWGCVLKVQLCVWYSCDNSSASNQMFTKTNLETDTTQQFSSKFLLWVFNNNWDLSFGFT